MKKLICFAILLPLLMQYNPAAAQNCSAAFTYTIGSNHTVTFYAADSTGDSRRWVFGDGSSLYTTAKMLTHTYAQPGQYTVVHYTERTAPNICHDSVAKTIAIPADSCNITARFEYYKDSVDCKKIHFLNYPAPQSANAHFSWSFGDGSYTTEGNPVHTYSHTGTYYVCLVSEAGTNCRKEFCDSVRVICWDSCAVQPYFNWKADSMVAGKIHFYNYTKSSNAGVHYTWNFGDSSALVHDSSPSHVYAHAGVYTVCLVAEAGSTCRKEYCRTVEIKEPNPCTIKAAFGHYTLAWAPLTTRFEAANQGDSAKYYWSFGDSTHGDGRNTTHYYKKSGWYTVCLAVIKGNCQASTCQPVFVGINCDSVQVRYTYTRNSTHTNQISFKAAGNDPALVQLWTIYKLHANGTNTPVTVLAQVNPSWTFRDTGWYRVCLLGITSGLCRKEYCDSIHIEKVTNGSQFVVSTPNPAINTVTFEVTLDKPEQVIIKILDGNGIIRAEFIENGATGNNRFTVPVERLSRGIYLVEIYTGTHHWYSRFQKG